MEFQKYISDLLSLRRLLDLLILLLVPPNIYAEYGAYARTVSFHCLVYPVYTELRRRVSLFNTSSNKVDNETSTRAMFTQMRRLAVSAAVEVARQVNKVSSLSCITHLPFALLREWALVLIDEVETVQEMGVDRITALTQ